MRFLTRRSMSENSENRLVHTQLYHCTSLEVKNSYIQCFWDRGATHQLSYYWQLSQSISESRVTPYQERMLYLRCYLRRILPFMDEGKFLLMGKIWLMHKADKLSTVGRGEGRENLLCLIFFYLGLKCEFYFTVDSVFPVGQNPKSTCCFWLVLVKFVLLCILM